jgi:hypothetical protein
VSPTKRPIRRLLKRLLIVAGGGLLFLLIWNSRDLYYFSSLISGFYAKEYCSCFFITGHDESFCHDTTRQYIPISSFALDKQQRTVTVGGMGRRSRARYTGVRTGCTLD